MIKVFEAFSGIGTQAMSLRNIGAEYEIKAIAEVDEYALLSYHAIHTADVEVPECSEEEMQAYMEKLNIPLDNKGKRKTLKGKRLKELYIASKANNNLGDISKVKSEEIPEIDLFTYSFPCQSISVAGKMKGLKKGEGTRSGLLWECERVIRTVKPKYLLMENVKNLVSRKFIDDFYEWLALLESYGYKNYWKVLNGKDYKIPQNRERVFCVSILNDDKPYEFPEKYVLEKRLKDVLEQEVDEKYYLNTERAKELIKIIIKENNINKKEIVDSTINKPKVKQIMNTITARYDAGIQNKQSIGGVVIEPIANRIGGIYDKEGEKHQAGSIWDLEQLSPTIDTGQGGWRQPAILEKIKPICVGGVGEKKYGKQYRQGDHVYDGEQIAVCLQAEPIGNAGGHSSLYIIKEPKVLNSLKDKNQYGRHFEQNVYEDNRVVRSLKPTESSGNISKEIQKEFATLRTERTEYGKKVRKQYENHAIEKQRKNMVQYTERTDDVSNTLTTVQKDNLICEKEFLIGASRGRNKENPSSREVGQSTEQRLEINKQGVANTLTTVQKDNYAIEISQNTIENYRIRKLTPLECWRLMGCTDEDYYKAEKVVSQTQLYKQAGNAIIVTVLEEIFKKLFNK